MTAPAQNTLVQPNHGYHVHGWMVGLGLHGLQLELYALIYSHTCSGGVVGKIAYFAAWTNARRCAIMSALDELRKKGLITARKGGGNCTLYSACNPKDRVVWNSDRSSLKNRLESSGIQTTLTRNNQKVTPFIEELVSNRPVKEQALAVISALNLGFSEKETGLCADKWLDTCRAHGWVNRSGQPIRDWQAHLRNYARAWAANNARPAARSASCRKPSTSSYNDKIASEYR